MTGPSTAGHLDLDALADVLAGERAEGRHLRSCAACTERLAELADAEIAVAASLATLPAPPLPDGLSERLAGALRAEAARTAAPPTSTCSPTGPASARTGAGGSVTHLSRRRRRTPSWLPGVAAGVALVLAGGFGLSAVTGTGGDEAATDTSAAGGAAQESSATAPDQLETLVALAASSGTDYAREGQRTTALPRLLADGGATTSTAAPRSPLAGAARPPAPAGSSVPAPSAADGAAADAPLERLRDPVALSECLAAVARDGSPATTPLSLDFAAFEGAPALAVVQASDEPSLLVLTVVGPGCSGATPDTLLRTRLPRP